MKNIRKYTAHALTTSIIVWLTYKHLDFLEQNPPHDVQQARHIQLQFEILSLLSFRALLSTGKSLEAATVVGLGLYLYKSRMTNDLAGEWQALGFFALCASAAVIDISIKTIGDFRDDIIEMKTRVKTYVTGLFRPVAQNRGQNEVVAPRMVQ